MGAGLEGNEAVAPPGIGMEIITEGHRPRRPCARGPQGQRGRCPSTSMPLVATSRMGCAVGAHACPHASHEC